MVGAASQKSPVGEAMIHQLHQAAIVKTSNSLAVA